MPALPKEVSAGWDDRKGPVIFATVNQEGVPNAIYASCVSKFSEDKLVIADNYFDKTRANIESGSPGSILFMTNAGKAYQVKGSVERHTSGEIYEDMLEWCNDKHPRHAAAVLNVEEVYSGAEELV
ncbi:MAG: pyridoxamine 5'-phosphate oxidase family protein [Candidatus Brocadiia bacterium]